MAAHTMPAQTQNVFSSDILAAMPVSRWIELLKTMPQDAPLKIEFAGEQYPVLDVTGPHAGNDNLVLVAPTKAEMSLRALLTSNRLARQKNGSC